LGQRQVQNAIAAQQAQARMARGDANAALAMRASGCNGRVLGKTLALFVPKTSSLQLVISPRSHAFWREPPSGDPSTTASPLELQPTHAAVTAMKIASLRATAYAMEPNLPLRLLIPAGPRSEVRVVDRAYLGDRANDERWIRLLADEVTRGAAAGPRCTSIATRSPRGPSCFDCTKTPPNSLVVLVCFPSVVPSPWEPAAAANHRGAIVR
jgi:hypothetical protein